MTRRRSWLSTSRVQWVNNESGAMMVLGVFFCIFLTATVYAIVALGRTVLERESLQDAADAAAFSAAILQARGMNLLVFINLLMAALVGVLVALKLVQSLMTLASVILFGLAWPTFGATLPPAGLTAQQASQFSNLYDTAQQAIFPALRALHTTEEALSVLVPQLAAADALQEAALNHPPALGALALPGSHTLPVESDEFSALCGKGSSFVSKAALLPVEEVVGDDFLSPVRAAAEEMGKALAGYLCGEGDTAQLVQTERVERAHPRSAEAETRCANDARSAACAAQQAELLDAAPHEITGDCKKNCSANGPYAKAAQLARKQCGPTADPRPHRWTWQERRARVKYVARTVSGRRVWVEDARRETLRLLRTTEGSPCGPNGSVDSEWNEESRTAEDEAVPVCFHEKPLGTTRNRAVLPPTPRAEGQIFETERVEATHVLGCQVWVEEPIELASKKDVLGSQEQDKSPHRIQSGVELGTEVFQLRAVAWGPRPGRGRALEVVKKAAWGRQSEEPASEFIAAFNSISIAQAEFYFDHDGTVSRTEWLWEPRWTARLKRFRLPSSDQERNETERRGRQSARDERLAREYGPSPQSSSTCSFGPLCDLTATLLPKFDELILH